VDGPHPGMVAFEQRSIGGKLPTNPKVFLGHRYQLTANTVPVH
jgi:hypothetical protein